MHPDLPRVRQLQELDNRIRELDAEISRLPKYIARIERQLESHKKALQADKNALEENRRSHRHLEGRVSDLQQKISHLRVQMGEAKTNQQFRAFQHEIEFLEGEILKVEDRILDKMVESESLEQNVARAETALGEESEKVAGEVAKVKERVAEDEKEAASKRARRKELTLAISENVLRTYSHTHKTRGGVAVAPADAQHCLACHVLLRPQLSQILRSNEEIVTCESCGRILYYQPPADAEPDTSGDSSLAANPLSEEGGKAVSSVH